MKRIALLVVFAATFVVAVNAQRFGSSTCGLTPGPCMERYGRQAYAPVDYYLNNGYGYYGGYGYGYGNGRIGTSAIIGGVAGAITGGLVAAAVSHRDNRTAYTVAPGGGQIYSAPQGREVRFSTPKPQKPLDCRKPVGKRGRNEAACAAVEAEAAARAEQAQQEADRQALVNSPWRLYNRSGFTVEVFDGNRPLGRMRVNQSWRVLEPASGFRAVILAPDFSGAITGHEARIRPSSDFQGWVITSPRVEE